MCLCGPDSANGGFVALTVSDNSLCTVFIHINSSRNRDLDAQEHLLILQEAIGAANVEEMLEEYAYVLVAYIYPLFYTEQDLDHELAKQCKPYCRTGSNPLPNNPRTLEVIVNLLGTQRFGPLLKVHANCFRDFLLEEGKESTLKGIFQSAHRLEIILKLGSNINNTSNMEDKIFKVSTTMEILVSW